jgi:hypothetical protein
MSSNNTKQSVRRIVLETSLGGLDLSEAGKKRYTELSGIKFSPDIERDDPHLVQTVEELKEAANPF